MLTININGSFANTFCKLLGGYNYAKMINKKFVLIQKHTNPEIQELTSKIELTTYDKDNWIEINRPNDKGELTAYEYRNMISDPITLDVPKDDKNVIIHSYFLNHNLYNDSSLFADIFAPQEKCFDISSINNEDINNLCLLCKFKETNFNDLSDKYYKESIEKMLILNPNMKFVVATNTNFAPETIDPTQKYITINEKYTEKELVYFMTKFKYAIIDNTPQSFLPTLGLWGIFKANKKIIRPSSVFKDECYPKLYRISENNEKIAPRILENYLIAISTVSRRPHLLEFVWKQIQEQTISPLIIFWAVTIDEAHCENPDDITKFKEFASGKNILLNISKSTCISDLRNENNALIDNFLQSKPDILQSNDNLPKDLIVCIQDDDDYYVKNSALIRIVPIIDGLTDVTGQEVALHYDLNKNKFFRTRSVNAFSSTSAFMAYTKTYANTHSYPPNVQCGEEKEFYENYSYKNNMFQILNIVCIAISHGHNTCNKDLIFKANMSLNTLDEIDPSIISKFIPNEDMETIKKLLITDEKVKTYEEISPSVIGK